MHDLNLSGRIERKPSVMMGKPVVKGTRLTVEHIVEQLARGATVEDVLRDNPVLSGDDVRAALQYALGVLRAEELHGGNRAE